MIPWLLIWLVFWFGAMGLPLYTFKKFGFTFYQQSYQTTVFYLCSTTLLIAVYYHSYATYFKNLTFYHLFIIPLLFLAWILLPRIYKNDYYTSTERLRYQVPKFFDILFQQLCFLGGLLTFGISPLALGILFFAVHLPGLFFLPKKFSLFVSVGSLVGGLLFAFLQSQGIIGFLVAFSIHITFWILFHYVITSTKLLNITPIKR